MISRREAIGGTLAAIVGAGATLTAEQTAAVRDVMLTFRGGFGFLIKEGHSLRAMTPKKPADACADWMDHPLYIKGNSNSATPTVPPGATIEYSKRVPSLWAVQLKGNCSIKTGGPTTALTGPQHAEEKTSARTGLEAPHTPVPYASANGWNDASWILPLGEKPADTDLNARVQDSLTVAGGQIDVLPPLNSGALLGRFEIPALGKIKKHKRALTDRIRLSYRTSLASLVITTDAGDVTITPKADVLDLEIGRELDADDTELKDGKELRHARMIYALATSAKCDSLKAPKFELITSRPGHSPTPGDFCPFAMFDIEPSGP